MVRPLSLFVQARGIKYLRWMGGPEHEILEYVSRPWPGQTVKRWIGLSGLGGVAPPLVQTSLETQLRDRAEWLQMARLSAL